MGGATIGIKTTILVPFLGKLIAFFWEKVIIYVFFFKYLILVKYKRQYVRGVPNWNGSVNRFIDIRFSDTLVKIYNWLISRNSWSKTFLESRKCRTQPRTIMGHENHYRPCDSYQLQISRERSSNRGQHRDDEYQILSSSPQVCTQPLM